MIYDLEAFSTIVNTILDISHDITKQLSSIIGCYRPSFAQFYDYFYWHPLKIINTNHLSFYSFTLSLQFALSPLQLVGITTIWKQQRDWDQFEQCSWVKKNDLQLATIAFNALTLTMKSPQWSCHYYEIIAAELEMYILNEQDPLLSVDTIHSAIQISNQPFSNQSTNIQSTHMQFYTHCIRMDGNSLDISLLVDHLQPFISSFSRKGIIMDNWICSVHMHELICVWRLTSILNADLHVMGLTYQWKKSLFDCSLEYLNGRIVQQQECLLDFNTYMLVVSQFNVYSETDNQSTLFLCLSDAFLNYLSSMQFHSIATTSVNSSILSTILQSIFTRIHQISIQLRVLGCTPLMNMFVILEDVEMKPSTVHCKGISIGVQSMERNPWQIVTIQDISLVITKKVTIHITNIEFLITPPIIRLVLQMYDGLESILFRMTTEKKVQTCIQRNYSATNQDFILPSLEIRVIAGSIEFQSECKCHQQVQKVALLFLVEGTVLTDQYYFSKHLTISILQEHRDNMESKMNTLENQPISVNTIATIPSIFCTKQSIVQPHSDVFFSISNDSSPSDQWTIVIPLISITLGQEQITSLMQIINDLQSIQPWKSIHFPINSQDVNLAILQPTYHRLLELRWKRVRCNDICKSAPSPSLIVQSSSFSPGHVRGMERTHSIGYETKYSKFNEKGDRDGDIEKEERKRIEALLRKMISARHPPTNNRSSLWLLIIQSLELKLMTGDEVMMESQLGNMQLQWVKKYPCFQTYATIDTMMMIILHPDYNNPFSLTPFEWNREAVPLSHQPLVQMNVKLELSSLITIPSIVISIAPVRLQFSIPALRSLVDFFNAVPIKPNQVDSSCISSSNPLLTSMYLLYFRLNPIRVYCALSPTSQAEYELIPFTLHPITLRKRFCTVKHIFKLVQGKLLVDLLTKSSQNWNQASAVVASAMGFSRLVSLLRSPIQLPKQLLRKQEEREKEKRIQQLLGSTAHLVYNEQNEREEYDILECSEERNPSFSNPLFDRLRQMSQQ